MLRYFTTISVNIMIIINANLPFFFNVENRLMVLTRSS